MALGELHSFVQEVFNRRGVLTYEELIYIIETRSHHYVIDAPRERIALTSEFAYSVAEWELWRRPWTRLRRRLAQHDSVVADGFALAMTTILRRAEERILRTDVLYYFLREAFSPPQQPPSFEEFEYVLSVNAHRFERNVFDRVVLRDEFIN